MSVALTRQQWLCILHFQNFKCFTFILGCYSGFFKSKHLIIIVTVLKRYHFTFISVSDEKNKI